METLERIISGFSFVPKLDGQGNHVGYAAEIYLLEPVERICRREDEDGDKYEMSRSSKISFKSAALVVGLLKVKIPELRKALSMLRKQLNSDVKEVKMSGASVEEVKYKTSVLAETAHNEKAIAIDEMVCGKTAVLEREVIPAGTVVDGLEYDHDAVRFNIIDIK